MRDSPAPTTTSRCVGPEPRAPIAQQNAAIRSEINGKSSDIANSILEQVRQSTLPACFGSGARRATAVVSTAPVLHGTCSAGFPGFLAGRTTSRPKRARRHARSNGQVPKLQFVHPVAPFGGRRLASAQATQMCSGFAQTPHSRWSAAHLRTSGRARASPRQLDRQPPINQHLPRGRGET